MDIKNSRILVTGGTGCIGTELIEILKSEKFSFVSSISRRKTKDTKADYFYGDICDFDFVEKHIKKADILIHLAAKVHVNSKNTKVQKQIYETNVKASENLFRLASKYNLKRVVFISSVAVLEEGTTKILNHYAHSKLTAEKILLKIHKEENLPFTILRPTTVFGKGDVGNIAKYIKLARRGIGIVVNKGNNHKSFVYNKDVARAIVATLKDNKSEGGIYVINGFWLTVKELLQNIREVFGLKFYTICLSQYIIGMVKLFSKSIYYKLITLGKSSLYEDTNFFVHTDFEPMYDLRKGLDDSYDYYSRL